MGVKLFTENTPLQSLAVIGLVLLVTFGASLRAGPLPEGIPPAGIGPFGKPGWPPERVGPPEEGNEGGPGTSSEG